MTKRTNKLSNKLIGKLMLTMAIAASPVWAQEREPGGKPPKIDFASMLAVDAKTAQAVEQVLQEQHEKRSTLGLDPETVRSKHEAIRQETEQKLTKLLTPVQLQKFHQVMPKPPHEDRPAPKS